MCGIGGIVLFDGGSPDAAGMQRMVDALRHRGPDDEGFWVQSGLGMAHTRLSVIDLSPAGRQPMHVEDPILSMVYFSGGGYTPTAKAIAPLSNGSSI